MSISVLNRIVKLIQKYQKQIYKRQVISTKKSSYGRFSWCHGDSVYVCDKLFSLHLSGSNLQAVSQQLVSSQSALSHSVSHSVSHHAVGA